MRLTLVILLFASQAFGATYYIAASGGSDENDGSIGSPWATFAKAGATIATGDTVYLRGGTYLQEWYFPNIVGPIVLSGYPGETAVIDGENVRPDSWGLVSISYNNDYWTVKDITIVNSAVFGVLSNASCTGVTLSNLTIHDCFGAAIAIFGDSIVVEDCTMYDVCLENYMGKLDSVDGTWSNGVEVGRSVDNDPCNRPIIRRNTLYNCWGEGIGAGKCDGAIIEDNVIYDCYSATLYSMDSQRSMIRRNIVYGTQTMPGRLVPKNWERSVGISIWNEWETPVIYGDTIVNNMVVGLAENLRLGCAAMEDALVANNTFVNAVDAVGCVQVWGGGTYTDCVFANNIVVQSGSLPVISFLGGEGGYAVDFHHNLYSKDPPSQAVGTGDVIGDPLFSHTSGDTTAGNLTAGWFDLTSSSPAINAGTNLGWGDDIGARQYTAPASSTGRRLWKRK